MAQELTKPEKSLVEREREKREAHEIRLQSRQTRLKAIIAGVELDSVQKVKLRKHVFKTDEQLQALHLSPEEIRLVREWEKPKKEVSYAVESSAQHVTARARGEAEKKVSLINVENMTIRLPEKDTSDLPPPVIIDVEAK